ncbi:carbohydrate ABC transporter permease [Vallitaleaceae bacterium 9-2]
MRTISNSRSVQQKRINKSVTFIILMLITIGQLFPLVWLVVFSLNKSGDLFGSHLLKWPNPPQWINYELAWTQGNIPSYLFNSILVTFFTISLTVILSSMLGYVFARMQWKLKEVVFTILLLGMMIPIHATLLPNFVIFKNIGLYDTYSGLIIPYVAFQLPISTLIMRGFMSTLPKALEEAAVIDGCNIYQIIFKIILPITKPAMVTVSVMTFIAAWNEFIMAATFLGSENKKTLAFSVFNFTGQYSSNYAVQFAVMTLVAIPSVIVYIILSEQVARGVTEGAVKG